MGMQSRAQSRTHGHRTGRTHPVLASLGLAGGLAPPHSSWHWCEKVARPSLLPGPGAGRVGGWVTGVWVTEACRVKGEW
jgi:hypothetical protein